MSKTVQHTRRLIAKGLPQWVFFLALVAACPADLAAQNIGVTTPFTTATDSYFERMGVNFGFSFPNGTGSGSRVVGLFPNGQLNPNGIVFNQGGFGGALPPFGGFDPASGARVGFGTVGGSGPNFSLGLSLAKGSTRTATTQAPSIVIPNGGFGGFSSGQFSPFVTSVSPVVFGNGRMLPPAYSPSRTLFPAGGAHDPAETSRYRLPGIASGTYHGDGLPRPSEHAEIPPRESSAQHGDFSVREIRRQVQLQQQHQAAETSRQQQQADAFAQQARDAENTGDLKMASYYLFKARQLATGDQLAKLKSESQRLNELIKARKR